MPPIPVHAPVPAHAGLAADASSKAAVEAIYAIKGRQAHVPLAVCLAEAAKAPRYGHCEHLPQGLLPALLPGPVTMLLRRKADAPLAAELTSSSPLIGVAPRGSTESRAWPGYHRVGVGLCARDQTWEVVWTGVRVPAGSCLHALRLRSLLWGLRLCSALGAGSSRMPIISRPLMDPAVRHILLLHWSSTATACPLSRCCHSACQIDLDRPRTPLLTCG